MRSPSLLFGLLLAGLVACGETERPAPPAASAPSATRTETPAPKAPAPAEPAPARGERAVADAKEIFATRCSTCHGAAGAGDGPGSAALDPKPRNFQDPAWQESVTDAHLEKIILHGGASVGKSPAMPGNPDLVARPEVAKALVAHVRGLAE